MESRINNRFLEWSRDCPGINYEVADGKLSIVIDTKTVSTVPGSNISVLPGYPDFIIGNGNFWIEGKHEFENYVEYKVSNIRFSAHKHTLDDVKSSKVSTIFPDVSYAETFTVILK
jgi:hypothetical protein